MGCVDDFALPVADIFDFTQTKEDFFIFHYDHRTYYDFTLTVECDCGGWSRFFCDFGKCSQFCTAVE